jgi:hypothetical protein
MKKAFSFLITMIFLSSCEELGIGNPEAKLLGTWSHYSSGAAAGGEGKVVSGGNEYSLNRYDKISAYDCTFEKNNLCDCLGYDKYEIDGPESGGIITLTHTATNESKKFKYNIVKDLLALFETLEEWKKIDSRITKIDYVHQFEKQ